MDTNTTTNQPTAEAEAEKIAKRQEDINANNEAGHEKNVKADEELHEANTDAAPKPFVEDNRNTPIIDPKTGAKSWR